MDISVQQYRCSIGRFVPRLLSRRSSINDNSIFRQSQPTLPGVWYSLLMVMMIPIILSLQLYPTIVHSENLYTHPYYPTDEIRSTNIENISYRNHSIGIGTTTTDLYSRCILSYMINIFASSTFSMVTNSQSKYKNGNRKNQGIKIAHWNKGSAFLQNKMPEIRNIISGLHPHIIGISEANLHTTMTTTLSKLKSIHFIPVLHLKIQTRRLVE